MTILKALLVAGVAVVGLSSVADAARYHERARVHAYDAPYSARVPSGYVAPRVYGYDAPGAYGYNYGADANTAAAARFQNQFKNTY